MRKNKITTYTVIQIFCTLVLFLILGFSAFLKFGDDFIPLMKWWGILLLSGVAFYPLTTCIFYRFGDNGYLFGKGIGIVVSAWLMWVLSSCHILRFTEMNCWICLIICASVNYIALAIAGSVMKGKKTSVWQKEEQGISFSLLPRWERILFLELLFFILFLFYMYMKGFNPKAYGTEKMMDYGFMTSMYRTDYFPPNDFWFAGENLNYYYFGQYLMTFVTKLSLNKVYYGYNLALGTVFAFCLSYVYALVYQILVGCVSKEGKERKGVAHIGGALAALAVGIAGNGHYIIFKKIVPMVWEILQIPGDKPSYWFPNSTRYIGYVPDTADKTIHEYPSYSFVLGDLHAHVVNIIYVLTVLAVLFAFLLNRKTRMEEAREGKRTKIKWWREIFQLPVIMLGFLIGIFMMSNYWDFPIYFVVAGAVILVSNAVITGFGMKSILLTVIHGVEVLGIALLTALPFNLNFVKMTNGIALAPRHTKFYQLFILWGFPVLVVLSFGIVLIAREYHKRQREASEMPVAVERDVCMEQEPEEIVQENVIASGIRVAEIREAAVHEAVIREIHFDETGRNTEEKTEQTSAEEQEGLQEEAEASPKRLNVLFTFLQNLKITDLYILILGLCAIGLVLVPEVIYVVDIYGGSYKRSNTMFKLTFQAFILFGIAIGYIITRFIFMNETKRQRTGGMIAAIILLLTCGYFNTSCRAWFGDIGNEENFQGIRADQYIYTEQPTDAAAINWLMENAEDDAVVLEANGDSYTIYNRVSVLTGLPTVLGWHTHEWLWHNALAPVDARAFDITNMYTAQDEGLVRERLAYYGVSYIFVGSCEYEKYESQGMDVEFLKSLGEVVYQGYPDQNNHTVYIIQVLN